MRLWAGLAACLGAAAACLGAPAFAGEPALRIWSLQDDELSGPDPERELPVGSLQKPFLVEAWARAHSGQAPPAFRCDSSSRCWRPGGHGTVDLERALSISCNAYFRALAADTPGDVLLATLRARGFSLIERGHAASHPTSLSPELAIGLADPDAELTISPLALLRSYRDLTRNPWAQGEVLRPRLLAGLREAARSGTARGLGQRGYWAKTGTVPALDGRPLATSGYTLVIDDAGFGLLALLEHGTGREAAAALGPTLARLRPWTIARPATAQSGARARRDPEGAPSPDGADGVSDAHATIRVRLFDALAPTRVVARNLESFPVSTTEGFVGPSASRELRPGLHLNTGLWELTLPQTGLARRLEAGLDVRERQGALVVLASLRPREYVAGVLAAEWPADDLRVAAGAAVLRYLGAGPRHADADVCDLTHCAFFVGRGPRVAWLGRRLPVLLPEPAGRPDPSASEREWERILVLAGQDGPAFWSSHCGGAPLSPFYVWGAGAREITACPRHPAGSVPAWRRSWPAAALRRAFGFEVRAARIEDQDGVWGLRVEGPQATRLLRFDEAHRLLAGVLGWDALPSPARRVMRGQRGFEAEGLGCGHRVGLCLDGPDGTAVKPSAPRSSAAAAGFTQAPPSDTPR